MVLAQTRPKFRGNCSGNPLFVYINTRLPIIIDQHPLRHCPFHFCLHAQCGFINLCTQRCADWPHGSPYRDTSHDPTNVSCSKPIETCLVNGNQMERSFPKNYITTQTQTQLWSALLPANVIEMLNRCIWRARLISTKVHVCSFILARRFVLHGFPFDKPSN